jgi:predicted RNase H-like HicB family nuclease
LADPSRYPIEIFPSDEDNGFIAIAPDLPGCSAFGKTQADAATEIQHAIKAWQEAAEAANNPVPEPSQLLPDALSSGRGLLRIRRTALAG